MSRKTYPTDVSDEEWDFAQPYLALTTNAPQRHHDLREVFNALRWPVRAGAPWRRLTNDLPPWEDLLALHVTPADEQERAQVLCEAVQDRRTEASQFSLR